MNKTFKSGVTWWLLIVIYVLVFSTCIFIVIKEQHWAPLIVMAVVMLMISWIFLGTSYIITDINFLMIKSGPFRWKVTVISNITKIQKPSGPTVQAAPSLDRIEVCYNKYDTILLSPKDKKGFAEAVKAINPAVEIFIE